jgi:hypothetical protein
MKSAKDDVPEEVIEPETTQVMPSASDLIVDAWIAEFGGSVIARNTSCWNLLMARSAELKQRLNGG